MFSWFSILWIHPDFEHRLLNHVDSNTDRLDMILSVIFMNGSCDFLSWSSVFTLLLTKLTKCIRWPGPECSNSPDLLVTELWFFAIVTREFSGVWTYGLWLWLVVRFSCFVKFMMTSSCWHSATLYGLKRSSSHISAPVLTPPHITTWLLEKKMSDCSDNPL